MSHTPGPWFLNSYMRHQIRASGECEEHCVAYSYPSSANSGANARLIAAAPDLLAACKQALGAFEHNWAIDWGDLERAIAKAEGD